MPANPTYYSPILCTVYLNHNLVIEDWSEISENQSQSVSIHVYIKTTQNLYKIRKTLSRFEKTLSRFEKLLQAPKNFYKLRKTFTRFEKLLQASENFIKIRKTFTRFEKLYQDSKNFIKIRKTLSRFNTNSKKCSLFAIHVFIGRDNLLIHLGGLNLCRIK